MIGVGVMHSLIGFILYGTTLREIIGAGVWDTLHPGMPARYLAFWFMFAGVAAMLIGYLADWIERHARGALPHGLGWTLLGIALVGAIVTPISGFWLVFPPALGALAKSRALPGALQSV